MGHTPCEDQTVRIEFFQSIIQAGVIETGVGGLPDDTVIPFRRELLHHFRPFRTSDGMGRPAEFCKFPVVLFVP